MYAVDVMLGNALLRRFQRTPSRRWKRAQTARWRYIARWSEQERRCSSERATYVAVSSSCLSSMLLRIVSLDQERAWPLDEATLVLDIDTGSSFRYGFYKDQHSVLRSCTSYQLCSPVQGLALNSMGIATHLTSDSSSGPVLTGFK